MTGLFIQLDVEYPSDDEFIEAGPMAELLYIRALCFIKRKATDGVVKKSQLNVIATGIPSASKHVGKLLDVGLFVTHADGWFVPAYLKRNPSKADIAAGRELSKEAGIRGNHERWHVGEDGKPSAKCPLCREQKKKESIGVPDRGASRVGSPYTDPDPESYTDPYPYPDPHTESSPRSSSQGETSSDDAETTTDPRIETVISLLADHQIANSGTTPLMPDAYRGTVLNNLLRIHGDRILQALHDRPNHEPKSIADLLALEIA